MGAERWMPNGGLGDIVGGIAPGWGYRVCLDRLTIGDDDVRYGGVGFAMRGILY